MKNIILATVAALGLAVSLAPIAYSQSLSHSTAHQGPYDNTGNGPGQTGLEGGGG